MMPVWYFTAGHRGQADGVGILYDHQFPHLETGTDLRPSVVADARLHNPLLKGLPGDLHIERRQPFFLDHRLAGHGDRAGDLADLKLHGKTLSDAIAT